MYSKFQQILNQPNSQGKKIFDHYQVDPDKLGEELKLIKGNKKK